MPVPKEQYPKQYMYKQIAKAKLFIDAHLTEAIDLDKMAAEAHFSKFHFTRLFKNIYNLTPNQYLVQVRIEYAEKLLQKNIPVKEVCMSVGFGSISTFKGLYKKYTGKTLSEYQSGQNELQDSMKNNPLAHIPHCLTKIASARKKQFSRPSPQK